VADLQAWTRQRGACHRLERRAARHFRRGDDDCRPVDAGSQSDRHDGQQHHAGDAGQVGAQLRRPARGARAVAAASPSS